MSDTIDEPAEKSAIPNVARAGGIMMASLLLSRVLGLVRDAVIAGKFGADHYTDSYLLAFSVPDTLFFLIAGGALSSAFIPVFSEYLHTKREDEAWHIFSVVTTIMSIIVTTFIVLAWIFAEPMLHILGPGKVEKVPEFVPLIVLMSRIVLPAQFAFFIGGLMFGTLYARQVFAVPGLGPNIYNLGIIFGAVILSAYVIPSGFDYLPGNHAHLGVVGMSWGALIGAILGNLLVPWLAMRKIGLRFKPSLDYKHPGVRKVFKLMLPVVLGLSLPGVYALIMQAFATYFQEGANTFINYSNKLMQAPLGIFGQSLAIGVFPALSQFFAQNRMDLYRSQLSSTLRTVIYLSVPVSVLIFVMAPQIVAAVLKLGEFTQYDVDNTASALRWFCLGISAWCLHPVLMRGFFAMHISAKPIILGTATTALFVALVLLLKPLGMGFLALPLAGSISAIALVIALLIAVSKTVGGLDFAGLGSTLWKSAVGSLAIGAVASLVAFTPVAARIQGSKMLTILAVLIVFCVGGWAYFFVTRALGMPETGYVSRAMDRLNKRRS